MKKITVMVLAICMSVFIVVSCSPKVYTITDYVDYHDLNVGEKYTIVGILMDKSTGKEILDLNGNRITAEIEFYPESSDGMVEINFKIPKKSIDDSLLATLRQMYTFE